MSLRPRVCALFALCLAVAAQPDAMQQFTKQQADRFQAKLVQIVLGGHTAPAPGAAPRATDVTDAEVNSYLRFNAADQIPPGIVEPTLNAAGAGRVRGRAVVDLDVVRKQQQRGWLDPMGYVGGRMPVTATGTLTTKDGIGHFQLESAEISGVTVPKTVLQELLSYYSATPEDPDGINMDEPFELPSRIREIRVKSGSATIVQ
jgi:hypothetical protein